MEGESGGQPEAHQAAPDGRRDLAPRALFASLSRRRPPIPRPPECRRPAAGVAAGCLIPVTSTQTSRRLSIRSSVAVLRVGSILLGAFIAMYLAIITYTVSNRRLLIFPWLIGLLALGLLSRTWRRSSSRAPKEPLL